MGTKGVVVRGLWNAVLIEKCDRAVLPKVLDEKVEKMQISRAQYGIGNFVVHNLMDVRSSAQKLRGAGFDTALPS